jgi:hypothetical protein
MAVSTSMHSMNLWKNRSTIALVIEISLSDMGLLLPHGRTRLKFRLPVSDMTIIVKSGRKSGKSVFSSQ